MEVSFKVYRGGAFVTWESLFQEAADFASRLSPENLISISHSQERSAGIVTVWYFREPARKREAGGSSDAS